MNASVCVISFSPIARDGRVLRQLEYLAPQYRLTVIGIGPPPGDHFSVRQMDWRSLPEGVGERPWMVGMPRRIAGRLSREGMTVFNALHAPRALRRFAYEQWYWSGLWQRAALGFAQSAACDVYHANDWTALPIAAEAARRHSARVVFDAHEYAPLELENRKRWQLRYQPAIKYFLSKYAAQVDAFTTVCTPIGRRYKDECGLEPTIVYNTPKRVDLPAHRIDPLAIRLVHHGAAFRDRCLEKMIRAVAACDRRFSLHFILVPGHLGYVEELKTIGQELAPGRVFFYPPVSPGRTVEAVAPYDIGFCLIEPSNYNYRMAAPNKFFDYIAAGMPVCIGPSPAMVEIAEQYGFGCIAPSFAPEEVAATLNAVDETRLAAMQAGARHAAAVFHADAEMGKLLALYRRLLSEEVRDPLRSGTARFTPVIRG